MNNGQPIGNILKIWSLISRFLILTNLSTPNSPRNCLRILKLRKLKILPSRRLGSMTQEQSQIFWTGNFIKRLPLSPTHQYPIKAQFKLLFCLCWGLTSQSTIFQSCRDGATASWVINQYFRGVKCLAQGHNTAAVGFEPPTSRSGVRHSTTEPPRSPPNLSSHPHVQTSSVENLIGNYWGLFQRHVIYAIFTRLDMDSKRKFTKNVVLIFCITIGELTRIIWVFAACTVILVVLSCGSSYSKNATELTWNPYGFYTLEPSTEHFTSLSFICDTTYMPQ